MAKKKSTPESTQPQPLPKNVPIVAIGASAGGQEAVVELLKNLSPTTGLAYVYIQHLDPTQESRLVDILGRATTMPVLEAEQLMRIAPNQLYVIPPDRDLEVLDGVLTLRPRQPRPALHMPIDQFFLSLAERQKEGAIAVVLSGTASDGTLGLRAIKAAGGITFAQDETARFQSMPRSAIIEGVVDRVLPPADIAKELERLSGQVSLFAQTTLTEIQEAETLETLPDESTAASSEDLRAIIQLLRRATGVDFSHYKITTIRRRIIRRTLLFKLDSLRAYAEYLRQHPEEASLLYDDLLINVTTFFRDADTMDYIQKVLLPQLVREKPASEPIRIWVPACSTGQEAYSLAILLLEALGERAINRTIQLFATDLSEAAVAKARLGTYTRGEIMDVSPRRLQRFFTKVDDHYRINKSVRDLCVFAPHNLLKDPPFSRLDLISCRNLLIYLDSTLQRKAIITFHYALNPNGYLVLGKSETVGASAQLFSQQEKNYKIFSRKNDIDSRVTFTMTPRQLDGDSGAGRSPGIPKTEGQIMNEAAGHSQPLDQERLSGSDLDKVVDSLLLNQYIPASVVVTQDMEILQFRGSTGLFLEPSPGKASLNLIRMARPALVFELRNAVHKAQKSGEPVRKSGLEFKVRNKTHYAVIEAVPLDTATEERLFLVVFQEMDPPATPDTQSTSARNKRIKELETELANLREDMRSIIEEQEASNEELQSANEEIISSNEELQSINEELETSKEEIESTNEELLTINQELQVRNDQLSEAYQFAEDIFSTIREATLVLDTELRVKSANPAFYRLFQLTEGATERRLIYELGNRQWDIPELRVMLTDIVTSGAQFQSYELRYESPEVGEKWLSLNARRVVRQQDSILLAIDDITEHRLAQQLLAEREAWFHQIADNAPTLIWVTDADGRFTFLNKVWLDFTGRSLDEVTKHGWTDSLHPDDQRAYQATYDRHVEARQAFSADYRLFRRDGEYRWMLENAQPMFSPDGTFTGFIGSSADVHLQKELNQELDRHVQERTEELVKSRDLFEAVINASPISIAVMKNSYDANGLINDFDILIFNDFTLQTVGGGNFIGRRYAETFPQVVPADVLERFKHVATTGESVNFERWYDGGGMPRWLHFLASKLDDLLIVITEDITERKQAEEQRHHQAEEQLRISEEQRANVLSLFSQAPVAIAIFKGSDYMIDMANEEVLRFWGRTRQQVMNKPLFEAMPEAAGQGYETLLNHVYTSRERFIAWELPVNLLRGGKLETAYINFVYEPYYDIAGDIAGIMVVCNEITEQVMARRQIEESARQLSTLVENTPDEITRWDKNNQLLFANSAFVSKTDQPLDALLGKTTAEIGHPDDIAGPYMAKLRKTFETRQPQEHYNAFPTANGSIQYYSRIVPEFGPDGVIESVLAIARDITELQQTAENLQAVLNSSLAAIGFLKPVYTGPAQVTDFRLVVCNREFAEITGQTRDNLTGSLASTLSDVLWQEQTIETIRQVLETKDLHQEERLNKNTGVWLLITLTRFDGGVVLTAQNITLLKTAEQQQGQLFGELEKSNESMQLLGQLREHIRERGEFLRSTSHDLRGNFGIIQGAATLLDMAGTDEERTQMLSMLQRNLRQATKMLTELLDVARLEAGQEARHIAPFDAASLLTGLIDSMQPMANAKNLWLRPEGSNTLPVEGDTVKVHRMVQNLLLNAVKYTQTGGVTVSWGGASDADHWWLTITDTGPGLPEEVRSTSGEGIGLMIVRQLCELLDCQMTVESQPGTGTRFELIFPRHYPAD